MEGLRDKVTLITGASSGIGTATAVYFAKWGSWLTLTGRNKVNLESAARQCQEAGLPQSKILVVPGEISDGSFRKHLIDETIKKFGRLDVLVNNAGIVHRSTVEEMTEEEFDSIFDINLKAPVFLSKLAMPHLIASKGCIVNNSSVSSTNSFFKISAYSATKSALDAFTRLMAVEYGPQGVRVNSVNPGLVDTPMAAASPPLFVEKVASTTPVGRNGRPEEVAHAIAFLAGDNVGFLTGHHLVISGGRHLVSFHKS